MNTRKIKTNGISPPQSYLIHPSTLAIIKKNNDTDNIYSKESTDNTFLYPTISFNKNTLLGFYNIKYITDLEEKLFNYPELTRIRLLKLLLENNNLTNLTKDKLPNIFSFLEEYYSITSKTVENNLSKLKSKTFDEMFSK